MHTQTQRKLSLESDAFAAQNPALQDSYLCTRAPRGKMSAETDECPVREQGKSSSTRLRRGAQMKLLHTQRATLKFNES